MISKINAAIDKLNLIGIQPVIINLSPEDYKILLKEVTECIKSLNGKDYTYGDIKQIMYYKGIKLDSQVQTENEAINSLFSKSFIASATIIQDHRVISLGRAFNLETLEEILDYPDEEYDINKI